MCDSIGNKKLHILLSFTYPHVITYLYYFICIKHKRKYFIVL